MLFKIISLLLIGNLKVLFSNSVVGGFLLTGDFIVLMNFPDLAKLLEARIAVIADHGFRDRDPEAHLEALKSVSEAIRSWHEAHRSVIDGNLNHFLTGASYQKALLYLESGTRRPCGE
jgi:hypothetical protein